MNELSATGTCLQPAANSAYRRSKPRVL